MSFDRLARYYAWLEAASFGDGLQRARIAWLREIASPRRVLIAGEGNGRFLAEFVQAHPGAEVDCVEASARMIELSRRRLHSNSEQADERVRFITGSIENVSLAGERYDLLVTHFFLDCFTAPELASIVAKLSAAATGKATWLIADFRIPAAGLRRYAGHALVSTMYSFFRLTTGISARRLCDPAPLLEANGFQLQERQLFLGGIVYSDLWRR